MTLEKALELLEGSGFELYPVDGEGLYQVWDEVYMRAERLTKQEIIDLAQGMQNVGAIKS